MDTPRRPTRITRRNLDWHRSGRSLLFGPGRFSFAGSHQSAGDRTHQPLGRRLSQRDIELDVSAVIVEDGVEISGPAASQQVVTIDGFDRQSLAVAGSRQVLLEGALGGEDCLLRASYLQKARVHFCM